MDQIFVQLQEVKSGEITGMIIIDKCDLGKSLADIRESVTDQISEFMPESYRFSLNQTPISNIQENKISLKIAAKYSKEEDMHILRYKSFSIVNTNSTFASTPIRPDTSHSNTNFLFTPSSNYSSSCSNPTKSTPASMTSPKGEFSDSYNDDHDLSGDLSKDSDSDTEKTPNSIETNSTSIIVAISDSPPKQTSSKPNVNEALKRQATNSNPSKNSKLSKKPRIINFFTKAETHQTTSQSHLKTPKETRYPAAKAKGLKIYLETDIEKSTGIQRKYKEYWNEKADSLCSSKKCEGWSKNAIIGAVDCSWTIQKTAILNEQVNLIEIQIDELKAYKKDTSKIPNLKNAAKNKDRMNAAKMSLDNLETAARAQKEEINIILDGKERMELRKSLKATQAKIDGAYVELKKAQDSLRKSLSNLEKACDEAATNQDNQNENTAIPILSLLEVTDIANSIKVPKVESNINID